MPIPPSKPKAALVDRLFVSISTVAFAALMSAVILALQLGRI
jgi:hypothetical protein